MHCYRMLQCVTPAEFYFPGDNLLVGTRQGHLLLYGVKDGTGDIKFWCVITYS